MTRALDRAVRQNADALSARLREVGTGGRFTAVVVAVVEGGAKDGNALVTVEWRGGKYVANGYNRAETPVVGYSVVCDLIGDQIFIAYSVIGQP